MKLQFKKTLSAAVTSRLFSDAASETAPPEMSATFASVAPLPSEERLSPAILSQMTLPTRPLWRAWRERGEETGVTVLRVAGLCPSTGINGRVVLQESVMADQNNHWGGEGAKSGLLVLERLMVPPALGETDRAGSNPQQVNIPSYPWCYPWEIDDAARAQQPLLVTFRKEEASLPPANPRSAVAGTRTSAPRYTHVTILPDGITVPIQE